MSRIARPQTEIPVDLHATADDRAAYRASLARDVRARVTWGAAATILLCGASALLSPVRFAGAPQDVLLGGLVVVVLVNLSLVLLARVFPPRTWDVPLAIAGCLIAAMIGVSGSYTGGFDSPITYMIVLLWVFGAFVTPQRVGVVFVATALELAVLVAVMWSRTDAVDVRPWAFWPFALGAASLCILGAWLRDRAGLASFVAHRRLETLADELVASREALAAANRDLEQRVVDQLLEIVAHARHVDALAAQLQTRVHDRARELAALLAGSEGRKRIGPGAVLQGRFALRRRIGAGGMGIVYQGTDHVTDASVAVKVIQPGLATDPIALQRFAAEAIAATAITHPAIVRAVHLDLTEDGHLFQVSELAEGTALDRVLIAGPLEPGPAARVAATVAEALAAGHAAGVVHRDIKPSNLLLAPRPPGVRVLDFGLAKLLDDVEASRRGLTDRHQLLGTPEYMSPEQIRDASAVTPATDVYSLGLTLYELLAGIPAFLAETTTAYFMAHLSEPAPDVRVRAPAVPDDLAALVARCLSKQPADRPGAAALATALTAIADRLDAPPAWSLAQTTRDTAVEVALAQTLER